MSQITGITRIKKTSNNPWNMWLNAIGHGMSSFANAAVGKQVVDEQQSYNKQMQDMMNRMYPQAGSGGGGVGVQPLPFQPAQGPEIDGGQDTNDPYWRNAGTALGRNLFSSW